ncbi:50S ribosome-binding GTPase [Yimella sp. cx-573]|nr:50S ribosome-binding GTPase [Yimella sp. cx-573]
MSPDLFKRKSGEAAEVISAEALQARGRSLVEAVEIGGSRLPADQVAVVEQLGRKVAERSGIAGNRTVVALAGATGSGKSSLFNALVGEPVSRIGARRPTTSRAAAAVWGAEPSGELLDWVGVGARHQVPPTAPDAEQLNGLVLLDLPDFDSRVSAHRIEADRVLKLSDVFVWVTDPQKYADAVLHDDYIRTMSAHAAVTVVVLNQIDRLTSEAARACIQDLEKLLAADGLNGVKVFATSAARGMGLSELRGVLSSVVGHRNAANQRLAADLRTEAAVLRKHVGDREVDLSGRNEELTDALSKAAAVPVVAQAVDRDYRMRAGMHGGWPFTRWASRLRPAPLSRLGLDKVASQLTRSEGRIALGRSSLPPASPAALASVDLATRRLGERAAEGLPMPWADSVYDAANPAGDDLRDSLDQAVLGVPLRDRDPIWWSVFSVLQWLFAAVAIAGLLWLLMLAGLGAAQIQIDVPTWGWMPIPVLMLAGGLILGLLLAALSRFLARRGAARRAEKARRRLRAAVAEVGEREVIAPVQEVLAQHRATREALDRAAH